MGRSSFLGRCLVLPNATAIIHRPPLCDDVYCCLNLCVFPFVLLLLSDSLLTDLFRWFFQKSIQSLRCVSAEIHPICLQCIRSEAQTIADRVLAQFMWLKSFTMKLWVGAAYIRTLIDTILIPIANWVLAQLTHVVKIINSEIVGGSSRWKSIYWLNILSKFNYALGL